VVRCAFAQHRHYAGVPAGTNHSLDVGDQDIARKGDPLQIKYDYGIFTIDGIWPLI